MRRELWQKTRSGLSAGFGRAAGMAQGLFEGPRGGGASGGRLRRCSPSDLRFEPLEPRIVLDGNAITINEIMYHPPTAVVEPAVASNPELFQHEFIELYNNGPTAVDLFGWQFDRGVTFTIPERTPGSGSYLLAAGDYLVVAADTAAFTAEYGAVTNLVGGWLGTLSNSSEEVRLINNLGNTIDKVTYSDSGDWSYRRQVNQGLNGVFVTGWGWDSPHDGGDRSLELVNPDLTNQEGQNWLASLSNGGTPGAANSVRSSDVAPLILDVRHDPAIPGPNDPVTVSARLVNEVPADASATLFYRNATSAGPGAFLQLPMTDDGSGQGIVTATIPQQVNGTIVEFYVQATEPGTEIVTNGTFDTDLNGWEPVGDAQWVNGAARINNPDNAAAAIRQTFSLTAGETYRFQFDLTNVSGNDAMRYILRTPQGLILVPQTTVGGGQYTFDYTPTFNTIAELQLYLSSSQDGRVFDIDNVSVASLPARTWPAPSDDAGGQASNANFQVDLTADSDFGPTWPVEQPIYRVAMTQLERNKLNTIRSGGFGTQRNIDALMNVTFLGRDPNRQQQFSNGDLVLYDAADQSATTLFSEDLFTGGTDIDAVHVLANGNILLSTDGDAVLGDNLLAFGNGDVVEYHTQGPSQGLATLFMSEQMFVGGNENIDALYYDESDGSLYLSTKSDAQIGSLSFRDGDVVRIGPGADLAGGSLGGATVTMFFNEDFFDNNAGGDADVNALDVLPNGNLLLSTQDAASLRGVEFEDGELVEFVRGTSNADNGNPGNSTTTLVFVESTFKDGNENIDAVYRIDADQTVLSTTNNAELGELTQIRYQSSIRIRGNGSRNASPWNYRIGFQSHLPFQGQDAINLNARFSHAQVASMNYFLESDLAAERARGAQLRINGLNENGVIGSPGTGQMNYGAYAQLQAKNGDYTDDHFPLDNNGNLYAMNDRVGDNEDAIFRFFDTAPAGSGTHYKNRVGHVTGYDKATNGNEDDWRDMLEIARAFDVTQTPDSTPQDDLNFIHKVSQVLNVNQWIRHMAATALVRNQEGGYANGGRGDDYGLFRGKLDVRADIVAHDLDTSMGIGVSANAGLILGDINSPFRGLFRTIQHPALFPIFYGQLEELMQTTFNSENLDPLFDEWLGAGDGDWVSTAEIARMKQFVNDRVNFVQGQIDIDQNVRAVDPFDLGQLPTQYLSLAAQQQSLRISEMMYNPDGGSDDLQFIELVNMGSQTLDITGVHFTEGILYGFIKHTGANAVPLDNGLPEAAVTSLAPGERVLVVKNQLAFLDHYDPTRSEGLSDRIAGEFWSGSLARGGEHILLEGSLGEPILDFEYSDGWFDHTDGDGFSLTLRSDVDVNTDRHLWDSKDAWRPSSVVDGSPGEDDFAVHHAGANVVAYDPNAVVINEVLAHSNSVTGDWIELRNTTGSAIDIGGWYLSDSGSRLRKFRIPDGTSIPAGGYVTFDQLTPGGFGDVSFNNPGAFGLSELGDTLWLSQADPDLIREDIDAIHVLANGNLLLSTDGSAVLGAGALAFSNSDVVLYHTQGASAGQAELFLSRTIFSNNDENIDALYVEESGGVVQSVVISTSSPAAILLPGTLTLFEFNDGDLVRITPHPTNTNLATGDLTDATVELVMSESIFDPNPGELLARENIDAVHLRGDGSLVISTTGPASITVPGDPTPKLFDDGDLIEIIPGAGANLAAGNLGAGAIVRVYLSESTFSIEPPKLLPTENIDAVYLGGGATETIVLSTASRATLDDLAFAFENGDVVQITPNDADKDLANGFLGTGATAVKLLEEDPASGSVSFHGDVAGYRERAPFDASERDTTIGVYTKSTGATDFVLLNQNDGTPGTPGTPGAANAGPAVGPVVINEIMYHPALPTAAEVAQNAAWTANSFEFIEIYNPTGSSVSLFDPANPGNVWSFSDGVSYSFPLGTSIPAGAYRLIVKDQAAFQFRYPGVSSALILGQFFGNLSNSGEDLELSRPGEPEVLTGFVPQIVVDHVNYNDRAPWPTGADGTGPSLSRVTALSYGNDVGNWLQSGPATPQGTPGAANGTLFDSTRPTIPTGLEAIPRSGTQIELNWTPSVDPQANSLTYRVYRNNVNIGTSSTPSFMDNTAAAGVHYYYRVTSLNDDGLETPLLMSQALKISILNATVADNDASADGDVIVRFSRPVDATLAGDVNNYQARLTAAPMTPLTVDTAVVSGDRLSVTLSLSPGFDPYTNYTLTVSNLRGDNFSVQAQPSAQISFNSPDVTPPTTPTGLVATAITQNLIVLTWNPSTDPESQDGIAYDIYRNGTRQGGRTATTFTDIEPMPGDTYVYTIRARNASNVPNPIHSDPFEITILAPELNIEASGRRRLFIPFFSEVNESGVANLFNYQLTPEGGALPVTIQQASLSADGLGVILDVTPVQELATYTLVISGLTGPNGSQMPQEEASRTVTITTPTDLTFPTVTGVRVGSTAWPSQVVDLLPGGGFDIGGGSDQLRSVPFTNVDKVIMQFSQDVIVEADDLSLTGVNVAEYEMLDAAFAYNAATFTATWTLATPLRADKLLLTLGDDVREPGSGNRLDGNWTNGVSTFPSGDESTSPQDNFNFQINMLPGDVTGAGGVGTPDLLQTMLHLSTAIGSPRYDMRMDTNMDGQINVVDLRNILFRQSSVLPAIDPQPAPQAADAVYDQLAASAAVSAEEAPPAPLAAVSASSDDGLAIRSTSRLRRAAVDVAVDDGLDDLYVRRIRSVRR